MEEKTVKQAIEAKEELRLNIEGLIRTYESEYSGARVGHVYVSRVCFGGESCSVPRVELEVAIN
jgi:hypothetical protein